MLEVLSREMSSRCLEELPYADNSAVVSELLYDLKESQVAWKGALESKGLTENVTKMG